MTKGNFSKKTFIPYYMLSIIKWSQDENARQDLDRETAEEYCLLAWSWFSFQYLFYIAQDYFPVSNTNSGLDYLISIKNQENAPEA